MQNTVDVAAETNGTGILKWAIIALFQANACLQIGAKVPKRCTKCRRMHLKFPEKSNCVDQFRAKDDQTGRRW
ncbi:hypothetical protein CRP01_08800 [Flavilitoribacter nigricans DSM 23189 = NBRC 102662]|uniref:Uncharacterized protein n=1 Tax=Flavilitoribacter nigricans (strain ATCC 23147 / DSM 23189 / NBRC 102662 / NCIMB 1420 / SS-2) TaxID=1122177 RepID=A0A2D0NEK7_FLAN2|nr:hypothetical protein CRP01_08800 [Flavilitoribacter nigricans DSM 23189 = NBRC 102662]